MHEVRLARLQEAIHRAISEQLLGSVADPRLQSVTVSRVQMSQDGANARIFILVREDQSDRETLAALRHARGFLRHAVAQRLGLRLAPTLHFALDRQANEMMAIRRLLGQESHD